MKTKLLVVSLMAAAALCGRAQTAVPPSIDSLPPVVVKTVPEAGSTNVAPGETEIKVVFSKEMLDQSWSPADVWNHSSPKIIGKPKYDAERKTWTLRVKLEPGKTYGYWLNSASQFMNFKDAQGHAAVPYLLTFKTSDK
jgi:hypothetical protein